MSYKDELKSKALERVHELMNQLKQAGISTRSVILFGSYARGDFTEESDVDVCVVSDNFPWGEKGRHILGSLCRLRRVQTLVYSSQEFLEALRRLSPVVLDILYEGVVLDDDGFIKKARLLFDELRIKFGLERLHDGWRWRPTAEPQP